MNHFEMHPLPSEEGVYEDEEAVEELLEEIAQESPDLAREWEERIEREELSPQEARKRLGEVRAKRAQALALLEKDTLAGEHEQEWRHEWFHIPTENIQEFLDQAQEEGAYLGRGKVAEVRSLPGEEKLCVKFVHNEETYALPSQRSLVEEARFLKRLAHIQTGVRVPDVHLAFAQGRPLLFMERLPALSIQQLEEGMREMDTSRIDTDAFEKALLAFLKEMHREGVIHHDLHEGNILIDIETGLPYVVDFGKAEDTSLLLSEEREEKEENDRKRARYSVRTLRKLLEKK